MENVNSHQTVRLTAGSHTSPEHGVCVMELASMLAGEPFSDRPRSVCPIIGSLLRAYNDTIDDARRQDLYAYAARIVGTAADRRVRRERAVHVLRFFAAAPRPRRTRPTPVSHVMPSLRRDLIAHATGRYARESTDESHERMLALIDRLIACGAGDRLEPERLLHDANDTTSARAEVIQR